MDLLLFVIGVVFIFLKRYEFVLIIILALYTAFFLLGDNSAEFPLTHNVSDTGIILFALLLVSVYRFKSETYYYPILDKLKMPLLAFGIFLYLATFWDLFQTNNFLWVIKTSRHWIALFMTIPMLSYFSPEVYEKALKYIFYITVVGSVLILLDHALGTELLGEKAEIKYTATGEEYSRGAIPSTFTVFYIFLLLTDYWKTVWNLKPWVKNLCLIILFATVVVSLIRSMIFSVLLGMGVLLYRTGKITLRQIPQIILSFVVIAAVLFNSAGFQDRMQQGMTEMTTSVAAERYGLPDREVKGNMSFRLAILLERAEYVGDDIELILWGIGNIPDEFFPEIFKIGLPNIETGKPTQLDTADISWPLLVLRLGYLGTFLFLFFLMRCLKVSLSVKSPFGSVIYVYFVVQYLLLSFTGSYTAIGFNYMFLFMLFILMEAYEDTTVEESIPTTPTTVV